MIYFKDTNLSVPTKNALIASGLTSIDDIASLRPAELVAVVNMGKFRFAELCIELAKIESKKETACTN